MIATIRRKAHFNAAHRLYNAKWSDDQNMSVFGKCSYPNYHGHNYELIVSITGEIDPQTGFVINLKTLQDLIKEHVEEYLDHKNLNLDIPEFSEVNPTAENIAVFIWDKLRMHIDRSLKLEIELYETPRNSVYYGGV